MGIGKLGCADDFLVCGIRAAVADIFHNVSCEQIYILLNNSNLLAKVLQLDLADVFSIQINGALGYIIKSGDQAAQGGFACARGAHKSNIISRLHFQIDIGKNFVIMVLIMEGNIFKANVPVHMV